ncbi:hypothetical protein [Flavobacterium sp.]|uniref:hypothetical protein n=1 Tax=Flavobacterium sp. TaxID=239 RepID=UPI0025E1487B|nr:hypothetical protein [Flavobacterium sp.]
MKKVIYIVIGLIGLAIFSRFVTNKQTDAKAPAENKAVELSPKEQFETKYGSATRGYKPVYEYLKQNLDDPSSLEVANAWNLGMNKDGSFNVKLSFRAKNSFGALKLQTINCTVDKDGSLSNIAMNE